MQVKESEKKKFILWSLVRDIFLRRIKKNLVEMKAFMKITE